MKYVKRFAGVLLAAAFIFGLAACGEKAPKNTDVTIEFEENSVQVALEESVVLKLKVSPESEASKVVWTSSNSDVATVDNQGKITAKIVGETEVKAVIGDKSATCRVTVTSKNTDVTIEFEEKSEQLAPEESVVLKLKVTPESEASKVVWTSSNPDVATVDNQGEVTAKVLGKTEVKAAIGDKSAICQVEVKVAEKINIGEKLGIGDKPFALNVANCLQYVWNYKRSKKVTYKGDKPAIIDFWATWCGPCKRIAPFLDELAKEYNGKAYVFKVELGGGGEPLKEEAAIFRAAMAAPNNLGFKGNIPAFLLLPSDGSAPKSVVGAGSSAEAALRKFFEEEVAKAK